MLHLQFTVLGFLILSVDSQYMEEHDVPKALPEQFVLDLYTKYKEAVEDGLGENLYFFFILLAYCKSIQAKN